jgi:hypothetical protein
MTQREPGWLAHDLPDLTASLGHGVETMANRPALAWASSAMTPEAETCFLRAVGLQLY